jgi:cytochrome P450
MTTTTLSDGLGLQPVPAARSGCPFDPPPMYEEARRSAPVTRVRLWDGSSCWLVTRYEDVRSVLSDPRYSADLSRPGFPFLTAARLGTAGDSQTFIRMDDPEHGRLRRMLTGDFMLRRIEALRPKVEQITQDLLDRMTDGKRTGDLVAEFALPLPSLVICLILGVPYEEHEYFQRCSSTILNLNADPEVAGRTRADLLAYMAALTERKRQEPDDGILSRLASREGLDPMQAASMGLLLLVAGHETTANMTAMSALALLRNPEQMALLRARPELVGGAVEELLRYLTVLHSGLPRIATEELELGGETIRPGEGVLCMINTANRDEEAFPDAARLDVQRPARHHVAFGFGVHQCLGQPLARLELQIALSALLRRLPDLRLAADFDGLSFRDEMAVYGVHSLPVAW